MDSKEKFASLNGAASSITSLEEQFMAMESGKDIKITSDAAEKNVHLTVENYDSGHGESSGAEDQQPSKAAPQKGLKQPEIAKEPTVSPIPEERASLISRGSLEARQTNDEAKPQVQEKQKVDHSKSMKSVGRFAVVNSRLAKSPAKPSNPPTSDESLPSMSDSPESDKTKQKPPKTDPSKYVKKDSPETDTTALGSSSSGVGSRDGSAPYSDETPPRGFMRNSRRRHTNPSPRMNRATILRDQFIEAHTEEFDREHWIDIEKSKSEADLSRTDQRGDSGSHKTPRSPRSVSLGIRKGGDYVHNGYGNSRPSPPQVRRQWRHAGALGTDGRPLATTSNRRYSFDTTSVPPIRPISPTRTFGNTEAELAQAIEDIRRAIEQGETIDRDTPPSGSSGGMETHDYRRNVFRPKKSPSRNNSLDSGESPPNAPPKEAGFSMRKDAFKPVKPPSPPKPQSLMNGYDQGLSSPRTGYGDPLTPTRSRDPSSPRGFGSHAPNSPRRDTSPAKSPREPRSPKRKAPQPPSSPRSEKPYPSLSSPRSPRESSFPAPSNLSPRSPRKVSNSPGHSPKTSPRKIHQVVGTSSVKRQRIVVHGKSEPASNSQHSPRPPPRHARESRPAAKTKSRKNPNSQPPPATKSQLSPRPQTRSKSEDVQSNTKQIPKPAHNPVSPRSPSITTEKPRPPSIAAQKTAESKRQENVPAEAKKEGNSAKSSPSSPRRFTVASKVASLGSRLSLNKVGKEKEKSDDPKSVSNVSVNSKTSEKGKPSAEEPAKVEPKQEAIVTRPPPGSESSETSNGNGAKVDHNVTKISLDGNAEENGADGDKAAKNGLDVKGDVSQRVIALAKKSEWTMVENILRNVTKKGIDLTLEDDHGFNALQLAVKDGRISTVERLFELGAELDVKTKDGRNLAHIAAQYAKEDMIKHLITRKIDVTEPGGPRGQLPLHMACSRPGQQVLPLVQILLRATQIPGKDVRMIEDQTGCIPLLLACEAGNGVVARELLQVLPDKQAKVQRKDTGDTALHLAVKKQDVELVQFLIDHGANVDAQNKDGQTALHLVALSGEDAMLRQFFKARADANTVDKDHKTPLHIAAEHGHTAMVEILIDKFKASILARTKDGSTLMHIASQNGHPDTALAFLKRGVPLHMPNKSGATGLHSAAAQGHVRTILTLIQKGANVDQKTKDNYTPLHVAVQYGRPHVVECLLGYGANVSIKGGKIGETPLHIAASLSTKDGERCAEMLIKSGAETNIKQENGETPLHIAAKKGNPGMVRLLLNEEGDPMITSKNGETALHVAARHCHYSVCKMLLEMVEKTKRREDAVVLVNQQTSEGESAVHYAAEVDPKLCHYPGEDVDIIKLLLSYGGEVNIPSTLTQETVIHYCARSGNGSILKQIVETIGPGMVQIALNKPSKNGWSPLLVASEKGHLNVTDILLENHARVDVFDEHGKTALHLAAENGHLEVCEALLKSKAFINSKTKLGVTPLHLASMQGHNEVVVMLVGQYKAAIDATTLDNRTPLHVAAKHGQLGICRILINMGANANARDSRGQTPLHLAAESDYPDVVKLFLKMKHDLNSLTATDENGFTAAHIAAMKGSGLTIKELMQIDKDMVIQAQTKTTESNTLHLGAAGGHRNVVALLLKNGSEPTMENANGMTCMHLAAKYGHTNILDCVEKELWGYTSKKTGLNALHVAAHFGQTNFVQYILSEVPATVRSDPPTGVNPLMVKELSTEYGITPLHMASQSGHEALVRLLLNSPGVQVDAPTSTQAVIPLHLAAQCGHVATVGLLLSRSTHQLNIKDSKGRTALHLAATNGHLDMVSLLIGQGANINAMDANGYTSLHCATKAGHLNVVRLLVEAGADPMAETRDGKVAICFAAGSNHIPVLSYLVHHEHDTYQLMEDRKFIFDLMVAGKSHGYKPIEEFILLSPAPIDTAVKLSSIYREMTTKEKERAKDLMVVSEYCEELANELLTIASASYNANLLLKAKDNRGRPFLDVLIEHEQKRVVSHAVVQRYLTEIWNGGLTWGTWKYVAGFFALLFCVPLWIFLSLPMEWKITEAPALKFLCHLVSHIYFTSLLIVEILALYQPIYLTKDIWPTPVEWVLLLWLSGLLVAELSQPGARTGLGVLKIAILFFAAIAVMMHVAAFVFPDLIWSFASVEEQDRAIFSMLYIKNQFFALVCLMCFVGFLEFLTVHHLFGPWAIIIRDLMYDLMRFLVILLLFIIGFTLHVTSIFKPAFESSDQSQAELAQPLQTLEMLFFALFGVVDPDQMPPLHRTPDFSIAILKVVFGVYMMVTLIVLINLLIAMMSDTYQRIQAQSDTEWKFGRAKLIRAMNKKSATPAPINVFTKFFMVMRVAVKNKCNICTMQAQEDMRFQENIDSYSMSEKQGRVSPDMKRMVDDHEHEGPIQTTVELGKSHQWQIDTVIDWKRVVETFRMYQGGGLEEAENKENEAKEAKDNIAEDLK